MGLISDIFGEIFGGKDSKRLEEALETLRDQLAIQHWGAPVLEKFARVESAIDTLMAKGKKEQVTLALSTAKNQKVPVGALGRNAEDAARNLESMPKGTNSEAQKIWEESLKRLESKLR